jgi:hypothetical protein
MSAHAGPAVANAKHTAIQSLFMLLSRTDYPAL